MGRSESQTTEIKQSLAEWREVIESIAAFATSQGGVVRIGRNTRQGIRITGRPEREIVPEYPEEAVREALIKIGRASCRERV